MRVSTRMMYGALSDHLVAQSGRLMDAQRRIATGQRLQRPSDDPAGAGRTVALDGRLSDIQQYKSNAGSATAGLAAADNAIDDAAQAVREARRLALAGANDSNSEAERRLMADQVDKLIGQVRQAADTRHSGQYLFSGTSVRTSPLTPTGSDTAPFAYAGNDAQRLVEIADGVTVATNLTGRTVFNFDGAGTSDAPDVFTALTKIRDDLLAGNSASLSENIGVVDALLENFSKHRGGIGQTIQRMELNSTRLAEQEEVLNELRANITGADIAAAVIEYQTQQTTYQATVALASRVDLPGLFEYLR